MNKTRDLDLIVTIELLKKMLALNSTSNRKKG